MSNRRARGFTLIDVLLSAVILIVAISGAIQFRYHAAINTRKANMHNAAAELALILLETWRGVEGEGTFDSASHYGTDLAITPGTGPECPEDYTPLGSYEIQWSDFDYTATLSSRDLPDGLRAVNVIVAWTFGNSNTQKDFRITSYADTN